MFYFLLFVVTKYIIKKYRKNRKIQFIAENCIWAFVLNHRFPLKNVKSKMDVTVFFSHVHVDILFEFSKRKPLSFSDDQSVGQLLSRTKQLRPITIPSGADISSCYSSFGFCCCPFS